MSIRDKEKYPTKNEESRSSSPNHKQILFTNFEAFMFGMESNFNL